MSQAKAGFRLVSPDQIDQREIRAFIERREETSISCVRQLCIAGIIPRKQSLRIPQGQHKAELPPTPIQARLAAIQNNYSGRLCGILSATPAGLVQHCIALPPNAAISKKLTAVLTDFFAGERLYCISGELRTNELLEQAASHAGKTRHCAARDYLLMKYTKQSERELQRVPAVIHCTAEDADALYPLQEAYDKVEVIPRGWTFNPSVCRLQLERSLKTGFVFAIQKEGGGFAAKAHINADGCNWVQIGGVYTLPECRNQGYASSLVRHIAREATRQKKQAALFVHDQNKAAIAAYKRAGFEPFAHYRIAYYG